MSVCEAMAAGRLRWWPVTAVLATSLAHAQDVPVDKALPTSLPSRPLGESADRLVQKLGEDANDIPCAKVSEGVPCFPVTTSRESRPEWTVSVRDSLSDLGPADQQSPSRPPTENELKPHRPGPVGPIGVVFEFDPGCAGKSALKRLKGKNDTYYLYRVRDRQGERVALYGHRLDAATFQGELEFLGQFEGECKALAAYAAGKAGPRRPTFLRLLEGWLAQMGRQGP